MNKISKQMNNLVLQLHFEKSVLKCGFEDQSINQSNLQINSSSGYLVVIQDTDVHLQYYSLYQSTC